MRSTPDGRGGVVRKEKVARCAQSSGQQLFTEKAIDENGQVLLSNPVSGNQIDGSRPLYFERDGRVDALIPRLSREGQPMARTSQRVSTPSEAIEALVRSARTSELRSALGSQKPLSTIAIGYLAADWARRMRRRRIS